jgi:hypothetical protein
MNFLVPRKKRLKGFCPVQIRKSKSSLENEEILQSKEPKIEKKNESVNDMGKTETFNVNLQEEEIN